MAETREIDGRLYCQQSPEFNLTWEPCGPATIEPAATAGGVLGFGGIALAALAWVVWIQPLVTQYQNAIQKVVNRANRSLN